MAKAKAATKKPAKSKAPDRKGLGLMIGKNSTLGYEYQNDDNFNQDLAVFFPGGLAPGGNKGKPVGYSAWLKYFKRNFAVSSCVRLIAESMMANGWEIVPADEDIKPSEQNRAILEEFFDNCHPYCSFEEVLRECFENLALASRCYTEVTYNNLDQPAQLLELPQDSIYPKVDEYGMFDPKDSFVQVIGGPWSQDKKTVTFEWKEILWNRFHGLRGNGVNPLSPIEMLELPINSLIGSQQYIHSYFESGGKMGLILENAQWDEGQAQEMLKYYNRMYTRADKAHQILVLYDGTTVKEPPKSFGQWAQFLDVQKLEGRKVCGVFNVDPRLIAYAGEGNLGGKGEREQVLTEFHTQNVNPKKAIFSTQFNKQIVVQGFGITDWIWRLKPFRVEMDETARQVLAATYDTAINSGYVFKKKYTDVLRMRAQVDGELDELTEEEFEELSKQDEPELDENGMPIDPNAPPHEEPDGDEGEDPEAESDEDGDEEEVEEKPKGKPKKVVKAERFNPHHHADGTFCDQSKAHMHVPAKGKVKWKKGAGHQVNKETLDESLSKPVVAGGVVDPKALHIAQNHRRAPQTALEKRTPWDEIETRMSSWEKETVNALLGPLKESLAKSREKLAKWYEDGDMQSYKTANLLPGAGSIPNEFKKRIKAGLKESKQAATKEIENVAKKVNAKQKPKPVKRAEEVSTATVGDIEDYVELFGLNELDAVYNNLVTQQREIFLAGARAGWSPEKLVEQLETAVPDKAEALLTTVVRTSGSDLFNVGRQLAAEESGIVDFYEYSGILDDRECPVCEGAEGLQLAINRKEVDAIRGPVHFNCRCLLTFGLTGEDFKTDESKLENFIKEIDVKFGGKP